MFISPRQRYCEVAWTPEVPGYLGIRRPIKISLNSEVSEMDSLSTFFKLNRRKGLSSAGLTGTKDIIPTQKSIG
jgi:hypothetical protein